MSSTQDPQSHEPITLDAETIAEYLHQNPEFFEENPDILADLNISHQVSGAISLVDVEIHHGRAADPALGLHGPHCDRHVVEHAEALAPVREGVVGAPCEIRRRPVLEGRACR